MHLKQVVYPFSAIVGQEKLKLALILNAVNPRIGGVLITGAKGTGKSTIVRALVDLLPEIEVVDGCSFNCHPTDPTNMCNNCLSHHQAGETPSVKKIKMRIIQLPLGSTEDRVIGALDTEKALHEGLRALQPGLLSEANQGILYIDEVNLLPDHLVHAILDPAASGWNVIQRESISLTHPSRFILIATMNPEEGDLRPQILDRFPLHAQAETMYTTNHRTEIMLRNTLYEQDPIAFREEYEPYQEKLRQKINTARKILPKVQTPDSLFDSVAKICSELEVDGHRPDIVTIKAAATLAAFNGRVEVKPEDILTVSELTLSHRTRKTGLEAPLPPGKILDALKQAFTELRVAVPPTSKGVMLRSLTPKQIDDAMRKFSAILGAKKPVLRRKTVKKKRLPKAFSLLFIPILIVLTCYLFSAMILTFYYVLLSPPGEGISSVFSLQRTLPLMPFTAAITLFFFIFFRRQKKPSVLFLYEPKGQPSRRIVPLHTSSERVLDGGTKEQLIALRGSYIRRLYKALLGYGRKVAESLFSLRPYSEQFPIAVDRDVKGRRHHLIGKHTKTITTSQRGRYVWYEFPKKRPWDIALAPTIRAAAPYQINRKPKNQLIKIKSQDIRVKVRESRTPLTIVLLIDMSESMTASLNNIRDAVLNLHKSAYRKRDRLGLVVFKGSEAYTIQNPTTNLSLVVRKLLQVGASDYTPLAAGMLKAWKLFRIEKYRNKDIIPVLVIISDGIVNVPLDRPLSLFTRSRLINPSQADVLDAAYLLSKEDVQTIVINTDHRPEEQWPKSEKLRQKWLTPIDLLLEVTRIVEGGYYGITEKGELKTVVLTEALSAVSTQIGKKKII